MSTPSAFAQKTIVVGISGGIAAYKACELVSRLTKAGADVHVVMTASAVRFVTPLTLQTLSNHPVITEMFDKPAHWNVAHVSLAEAADAFLLAPATANLIAKMRTGIADDFLTTTLLATEAPIVLAPAMNVHMYGHPTVQENLAVLRQRGVQIVEPGEGFLACGTSGKGRLAEPDVIIDKLARVLQAKQDLAGKQILITAGGTREAVDPVRFLGNRSSGKMGYALAAVAARRGAKVTLVSTVSLPVPAGVQIVPVETALEMRDAVLSRFNDVDVVIKAAAVADYRPVAPQAQKIKKHDEHLTIELVKNPDILKELGERKRGQLLVGFAAETHEVERFAQEKLQKKNADLLIANDVAQPGVGFGTETNQVTILDRNGGREDLPLMSKTEVAEAICTRIAQFLRN